MNSVLGTLKRLCQNSIAIEDNSPYAAILGLNPSQGARSPKLWNAVFKELRLTSRMIPLDIESSHIQDVLAVLDRDPNFIGGAVAVPYKEVVFEYLFDRLDDTTKKIGAVNCIFRDSRGVLTAMNTDGSGAISSLIAKFGNDSFGRVLVLGSGGAAKAVAAFLSAEGGLTDDIVIASRDEAQGRKLAEACQGKWVHWDMISDVVSNIGMVVNCTTIGSRSNIADSPLSEEQLATLPATSVVYDVNYDPCPTTLLKKAKSKGLKNLDGLDMNVEQAVIAFGKALANDLSLTKIRKIMLQVN
jgi:shikimate dehydrogenase